MQETAAAGGVRDVDDGRTSSSWRQCGAEPGLAEGRAASSDSKRMAAVAPFFVARSVMKAAMSGAAGQINASVEKLVRQGGAGE